MQRKKADSRIRTGEKGPKKRGARPLRGNARWLKGEMCKVNSRRRKSVVFTEGILMGGKWKKGGIGEPKNSKTFTSPPKEAPVQCWEKRKLAKKVRTGGGRKKRGENRKVRNADEGDNTVKGENGNRSFLRDLPKTLYQ